MTHQEALLALSRRLDEELPSGEERELEAHLASCAECRASANELLGALGALSRAAPVTPRGFHRALLGHLRAGGGAGPFGAWAVVCLVALSLAAGVVLALRRAPRPEPTLVSRFAARPPEPSPPQARQRPERPDLRLSEAERFLRRLPSPPGAVGLRLRGLAAAPSEEPDLPVEFERAGLKVLAASRAAMSLFESRWRRSAWIDGLRAAGAVGEARSGLLAPTGRVDLSPEERRLLLEENRDRTALMELCSRLSAGAGEPRAEGIDPECRRSWAAAMRAAAAPGELFESDGRAWSAVPR